MWKRVYFIGVGGIGMSALARFLQQSGVHVEGYDRTSTELTKKLISEGIKVYVNESVDRVKSDWDAIIYTPAIPPDHIEMLEAPDGIPLIKRSDLLGFISADYRLLAVAGTHGKTTTSTILAHLLVEMGVEPLVVLGGIYSGWNSNLHIGRGNQMVTEADEYDRSFLRLKPQWSIVNSVDADHLDIYDNPDEMLKSYMDYLELHNSNGGVIIYDDALKELPELNEFNSKMITFGSLVKSDYVLSNYYAEEGKYYIEWSHLDKIYEHEVPLPGRHNAMNTLAALALIDQNGWNVDRAIEGLKNFKGISRRFETRYSQKGVIIIDDYAHHPTEVNAAISTARNLYPDYELHVVFQAHLYSRTKDFMEEFATALSQADVFYSCEIYPAREQPIPGITGQALFNKVKVNSKFFSKKEELVHCINVTEKSVILILGAGNINSIINALIEKIGQER